MTARQNAARARLAERARFVWIDARYPASCPCCDRAIATRDPIVWDKQDRKAYHAHCFTKTELWQTTSRTDGAHYTVRR